MRNMVLSVMLAMMIGTASAAQNEQAELDAATRAVANENEAPVLSEDSTLADYLQYAALNSAELEAAFYRWKAALERVPQVKALPDPRFSYRYFIREIETRLGPQRQAFELSQTFPWFGKLELAGGVAMERAQAARQRYEAARLRLFFEIKDVYYEYYYLIRSIAVTAENVELLARLEEVARTRYSATTGSHADVVRAQVELGKLEDRLNSLRDLQGPIIARLNATLNRPVEAPLPVPGAFQVTYVSIDDEGLLTLLEEANPQLQALGHEVAGYRHAEDLARKQYAPDITLGLMYTDIGRSDLAMGNQSGDSGRDAIGVMLSLNIPIWRGKYDAAVQEARMDRLATLRERTASTNSLHSQLKMAIYSFRDAARKLDLYGNALVPKAAESLKVTEQAFRTGDASFLDLVDAQRTYLEFELAQERARADHEQGLARIEMLVGRNITP